MTQFFIGVAVGLLLTNVLLLCVRWFRRRQLRKPIVYVRPS